MLALVIAFSSLNILPLIIFPSAASILLGVVAVFGLVRSGKFSEIFAGPRKYFIAFVVLNIIYAALIRVNVLDPHLYRHEFKYMISFGVFVGLSLLAYKKRTEIIVYYTLIGAAAFSFAWFVYSLIDRSFFNLYLYPYLGVIWERLGLEHIYLGPYQSHNSAGGFYAVLCLIFLGLLKTEKDSRRSTVVFVSLLMILLCFFFTDSRAYMLGLAIIASISLGTILYGTWKKRAGFQSALTRYSLGASIILLVSIGGAFRTHMYMIPMFVASGGSKSVAGGFGGGGGFFSFPDENNKRFNNIKGLRRHSVAARFFLWKKALEDFYWSPIIGVGASRFDSDKSVINSEPRITLHEVSPELLDLSKIKIIYIDGFLYRINVSKTNIHLEQETHNAYLQVLAEGGILMFMIFAAMYYFLMKDLFRFSAIPREGFSDRLMGLAVGTRNALFCLFISSCFGSHLLGVIPLSAVLALSAYLISVLRQNDSLNPFNELTPKT